MDSTLFISGFLLGIVIGLYYFGGLWWTVRRIPDIAHPRRLLWLSYLARLVPTLVIMYLSARSNPVFFVALLPGFFLVRFILIKKCGPVPKEA